MKLRIKAECQALLSALTGDIDPRLADLFRSKVRERPRAGCWDGVRAAMGSLTATLQLSRDQAA